jgi:hypothetical protein
LAWLLAPIAANHGLRPVKQRRLPVSTQQSGVAAGSTRRSSAIWRRWPAAVGLLGAAFVALGSPDRETLVISLLVALACYLAAAALKVRWAAWAAIPIARAW